MLNLDLETFQYLEVLAFGLNQEKFDGDKDNEELLKGYNGKNHTFTPLVASLLGDIADSLATGVRRTGSWERKAVDQLTGWDGTINRGMFGSLVDLQTEQPIDLGLIHTERLKK